MFIHKWEKLILPLTILTSRVLAVDPLPADKAKWDALCKSSMLFQSSSSVQLADSSQRLDHNMQWSSIPMEHLAGGAKHRQSGTATGDHILYVEACLK